MVTAFRSQDERNKPRQRKLRRSPEFRAGFDDSRLQAAEQDEGLSGWAKKCAKVSGVITAVVGAILAISQVVGSLWPEPLKTNFETDGRVWLTRNSDNKRIEFEVNLTLLNEGKNTIAIPSPKVSLYVDSQDRALDMPEENLRFKSADGGPSDPHGGVHFPVYVGPRTKSLEKITCSIACGPDCPDWEEWHHQGLWHINLVFSPNGREVSRCFVFVFPVPDTIRNLTPDSPKPIPLVDCSDYGEGFAKRNS
jgi:hypothetical protein